MRLLIAGGGTGGHLYPALAVAHAFRAEEPDGALLLVGRKGGPEERLVPAAGFDLATVNVRGLDRDAVWKNVALPAIVPAARGAWDGRLRDGARRGRRAPAGDSLRAAREGRASRFGDTVLRARRRCDLYDSAGHREAGPQRPSRADGCAAARWVRTADGGGAAAAPARHGREPGCTPHQRNGVGRAGRVAQTFRGGRARRRTSGCGGRDGARSRRLPRAFIHR